MRVDQLWLTDFRSYRDVELQFSPDLTAIIGSNGEGKTNLVEALAFMATLTSFRGVPNEAMIRVGADRAIVRAEAERDQRSLLIETELSATGRNTVQVNRQRLPRTKDLLGALRVTVFSPDDLDVVKGGPGARRRFIDELLVALHPRNDEIRTNVDKVLRQRNALLRQSGGRLSSDVASTLDVWDERLAATGDALGNIRRDLIDRLGPLLAASYDTVASEDAAVTIGYEPSWRDTGLHEALMVSRPDDLRRGVTTVGPHRDEVEIAIGGLPARTHASQGEQRSLTFALRMAAHSLVTDVIGTPPVLILDDVFSELDATRSRALLDSIPTAQTVLTTAGMLPADTAPDLVVRIEGGELHY